MHAVSSLKPASNCPEEIAENQRRAKASWDRVFETVTYLGGTPTIKSMAQRCADIPGWSCIVNADIVVAEHLLTIEQQLKDRDALCAMSQRYEVVDGDFYNARIVDLGLDFFAATQAAWGSVVMEMPEVFVIGKGLWDYWLNNYLCEVFSHAYYDLTPSRVIFHPKHGSRGNQSLHMAPDRYMERNCWPRHNIRVDSMDKPH